MDLAPCFSCRDTQELIQDAYQRDPAALREAAIGSPSRPSQRRWRSRALRAWGQHPRSGGLPEAFLVQTAANGCLLAALTFSEQGLACAVFAQWLARVFAVEVMFALMMLGAHRESDPALPLARAARPRMSSGQRLRFYKLVAMRWVLASWRCWWWFCGVLALREVAWQEDSPVLCGLFCCRMLLWPLAAAALHLLCRQFQEERLRGAAASIVLRVPRSVVKDQDLENCSEFTAKSLLGLELKGVVFPMPSLWPAAWRLGGAARKVRA